MKEIDNRKLNCPEPVIRTRQALDEHPEGVISIVDNETARENVIRCAITQGCTAKWEQQGGDFFVYITGPGTLDPVRDSGFEKCVVCAASRKGLQDQLFLITTDQLGRGSEELGSLLMRSFIYTLTRRDDFPKALVFLNAGVKLCAAGSPVLEELALLEENGVQVLACGTCLDYYQLKKSLAAGLVTNMYDIADLLATTAKTTTL